jgi:iron complex transport system substrate-binding protein
MFVVVNRLTVKPGMGEKLIERFAQSHGLEDSPGFVCFTLLEPAWAPGEVNENEYLSMTHWESREAFEAWLKSDAFKKAHQGRDNSIFAGPADAVGYTTPVERAASSPGSRPSGRAGAKVALLKQLGVIKSLLLLVLVIGMIASNGCDQSPAADQQSATAITFTDDAGRQITLAQPADRIVAGASFAVELLMALDHPPVLRPDVPERKIHPEAARSIPTFPVQHGTGPDAEAIAAARPDLVILHVNFAPFADNISQTLGVPVALFEIRSVEDVAAKLELLGRITDKQQQATRQVETLRQGVSGVLAGHPHTHPRVLALFGTPEAFYAYRGSSYLGSMIASLDGVNVAADQEALGGMRSIAPLNLEQAIGRNAEVILVIPHGPPNAVMAHLSAHPAWSQMPAVKSKRVHVLDEVLFSSNPGPRAPQALQQLKQLLYPESP